MPESKRAPAEAEAEAPAAAAAALGPKIAGPGVAVAGKRRKKKPAKVEGALSKRLNKRRVGLLSFGDEE